MTATFDRAADQTGLLDKLTLIVIRAAAEIMRMRAGALSSRLKPDQSPVTAADETSEAVITDGLAHVLPGVPVVSEEAGMIGAQDLGRLFVLVDPLDGTRELLAGRDEFTVNVAIVENGAPSLGIVAAPASRTIWRGIIGRGAERLQIEPGSNTVATNEAVRARRWPAHPAITVSRSHLDAATEAFLTQWPQAERVAAGSALKFCRVAEGAADIYPRLAPTREWDVGAGHAVLEAAGGLVTTPEGQPLVYGRSRRKFVVPGFIAWGDPEAARAAISEKR